MKTIAIQIDAGDRHCKNCRQLLKGDFNTWPSCIAFAQILKYDDCCPGEQLRCSKCLDAEQKAKGQDHDK